MFILYVHHYNRVGPVHTYGGSFRDRACLCFAPTRDHTCESSTLCTYCKKLLLNFCYSRVFYYVLYTYTRCVSVRPTYCTLLCLVCAKPSSETQTTRMPLILDVQRTIRVSLYCSR